MPSGCRLPLWQQNNRISASRIPAYTTEIQSLGVEIVDSIDDLLQKVDCVLLETNDGTLHLEQAKQILAAGKPTFIDKPVAANLDDVLAIYELAKEKQVPIFSSSSLRYSTAAQKIRSGEFGKVHGCDAYSPCSLEPFHSDLFWYGIHGVETLYTVMGPGCESVTRTSTTDYDLVVGKWRDGRIGTFRGIRTGGSGYGGNAFCEKNVVPIVPYEGYRPLVVQIAKFFETRQTPVAPEETIEIYQFMAAAELSKAEGGKPVSLGTAAVVND